MTTLDPETFAAVRDADSADVFVWREPRAGPTDAIRAADYPLLAAVWDNDDDAIYDEL